MALSDEALVPFILGLFGGLAGQPAFPIDVRNIEVNRGADGQAEFFTIVTRSGLRYRVAVELEAATT